MACSAEYIDYVCETLAPLGDVHARPMMGDYVVYVDGKCVATVCDDCTFVKKIDCIADLMADAEVGRPYEGVKPCFVLDFSDQRKARAVIGALRDVLPYPKKKKNKT